MAALLKKELLAQYVLPMRGDDYYECFNVCGKGFVFLAMVFKSNNHCFLRNSMSGKLIKDFTLKEGGDK